jgi:hypothetical protein
MKKNFLIPLVLLGLGSCFSSAQAVLSADPFERYLKNISTNHREPSLERFAAECGVDVGQVRAKYAVTSGAEWQPTENLRQGLKSLDSDFYTTIEVWKAEDRVLAEMWPNSDDVGSQVRVLYCFRNGEIKEAEAIQWNMPLVQESKVKPWGYSRRWTRNTKGNLQKTNAVFVNEYEQVICRPKLDADEEKSLLWVPSLRALNAWKLPVSFIR